MAPPLWWCRNAPIGGAISVGSSGISFWGGAGNDTFEFGSGWYHRWCWWNRLLLERIWLTTSFCRTASPALQILASSSVLPAVHRWTSASVLLQSGQPPTSVLEQCPTPGLFTTMSSASASIPRPQWSPSPSAAVVVQASKVVCLKQQPVPTSSLTQVQVLVQPTSVWPAIFRPSADSAEQRFDSFGLKSPLSEGFFLCFI